MSTATGILNRKHRPYIERLRNDPRTRVIFDGFIAQAMVETRERYRIEGPEDVDRAMGFATRRAVELAMSFAIDNDAELQSVYAQLDAVLENALTAIHLQPVQVAKILRTDPSCDVN